MRIDELIWDEWNEEHIARHGIDPEEVAEVVFDPGSLFLASTREGQRRYLVLGLTEAGRYLLAVLEPLGHGWAYPVTAREMTDGERRRFKAKGK